MVFLRGELTASIRVQNNRSAGGPLPSGHQHRLDHQLAVLIGGSSTSRPQALNTNPARCTGTTVFGGAKGGDVGHPFGGGGRGREVSVQMIASPTGTGPGGPLPPLPPLRHALQPRSAHQAYPIMVGMQHTDPLQQPNVLLRAHTWGPGRGTAGSFDTLS